CGQPTDIFRGPIKPRSHRTLETDGPRKKCTFKAMEAQIIEVIVKRAFEKAREEHAVHTAFALANHIEAQSNLSAKTLLRLHKTYVQKDGSNHRPTASSIDQLCKYLGFGGYGEFRR